MKFITKPWELDAFEYDPYGEKPEWWMHMVLTGYAREYPKAERPHAAFSDKRSNHKALVGDWITRDVFGRIDVYSAKTFAQRAELIV